MCSVLSTFGGVLLCPGDLYIYIYIYMCNRDKYIYIYVICICNVSLYIYIYRHINVCIYIYMYLHEHVDVHICMYLNIIVSRFPCTHSDMIIPAKQSNRESLRLNASRFKISKCLAFQWIGTPDHQMLCLPKNRDSRSPGGFKRIQKDSKCVSGPPMRATSGDPEALEAALSFILRNLWMCFCVLGGPWHPRH